MRQQLWILCGIILMLGVGAAHADGNIGLATNNGLPHAVNVAMARVSAAGISDHVNFLASNLLEGRATGSRGGAIAAAYIATQFALQGLKPMGDHGSFLQTLRLTGVVTDPQTQLSLEPTAGSPIPLKFVNDYLVTDETGEGSFDISNVPIVFVGYGIHAPELHHDDYQGADVHGKIVLILAGLPPAATKPQFDPSAAANDYGSATYKFEQAARQGATGAILIHLGKSSPFTWSTLSETLSQGRDFLVGDKAPRLHAAVWIQGDVARVLFAASHQSLDDAIKAADSNDFKPEPLPVQLNGNIISTVRHFSASNVIGLLHGRNVGMTLQTSSKQAVMYTAHFDGLGVVAGSGSDKIYNGAVGNASGVGMLLETAQAWASAPQPPPHAMLFVTTTGGEQGQLGARYLSRHLPVPARDLALVLNYDTVPPLGIPENVIVSNAQRSRFMSTVKSLADTLHLHVESGASPHVGSGVAETLPFARIGIPAFSINEGFKFAGHSHQWGEAKLQDYRLQRYRQPGDKYSPEMNFRGNAKLVRYGLALGWVASMQPEPIRWGAGDAFGPRHPAYSPTTSTEEPAQP